MQIGQFIISRKTKKAEPTRVDNIGIIVKMAVDSHSQLLRLIDAAEDVGRGLVGPENLEVFMANVYLAAFTSIRGNEPTSEKVDQIIRSIESYKNRSDLGYRDPKLNALELYGLIVDSN